MDTIFVVENDTIGSWYIGKIKMKMDSDNFPLYKSLTHEQLNNTLYKKYIGYDTPYINLVFMNEEHCTCHGILKWLSNLEKKIKTDPEKYNNIEKLLKAGWHIHDSTTYSTIYVINIPEDVTPEIYADLKKNWGSQSLYTLKSCINVRCQNRKEKYYKNKQNPKFLFEQARKNVLYRMNRGYIPKKSTLVKYNLS
tara:strand:+ start:90 stop:674 length:585 start_codon:yes stop_codon:yes gene_type:complete